MQRSTLKYTLEARSAQVWKTYHSDMAALGSTDDDDEDDEASSSFLLSMLLVEEDDTMVKRKNERARKAQGAKNAKQVHTESSVSCDV